MSDMNEIGFSGYSDLTELQGIERLPALRGDNWYATAREMSEQDATIGAVLFAVEMMMRAVQWGAEASGDTDEHQKWADFLDEAFDDMPDSWANVTADALTYLVYGYSLFELVYKQRLGPTDDPTSTSKFSDGLIGWRKWAFRPQSTKNKWIVKSGDVVGWEQRKPDYTKVIIPFDKFIVFRSSARAGNPEGISLLKGCYRSYYHKKEIETQEAIGIGRDLAGLLHLELPANVLRAQTPIDQQALAYYKKIAMGVHRGKSEGILTPSTVDDRGNKEVIVSLLNSGGSRQFDTNAIIQRYKTDIAMRFLADYILVGHQQQGAYNVSESKIGNLERAVGGWLDMMEENVNEQAVARLMQLNGVPMEFWPKWKHATIAKLDLQMVGDFLQKMISAKVIPPTKELAQWVAEELGSPVPNDDELEEFFTTGSSPDSENPEQPEGGTTPFPEMTPMPEMTPAPSNGKVPANA